MKRYRLSQRMVENEQGEWVKYDDARPSYWHDVACERGQELDARATEIARLKAENAKLQAALDAVPRVGPVNIDDFVASKEDIDKMIQGRIDAAKPPARRYRCRFDHSRKVDAERSHSRPDRMMIRGCQRLFTDFEFDLLFEPEPQATVESAEKTSRPKKSEQELVSEFAEGDLAVAARVNGNHLLAFARWLRSQGHLKD
jgi:hypothetical protein